MLESNGVCAVLCGTVDTVARLLLLLPLVYIGRRVGVDEVRPGAVLQRSSQGGVLALEGHQLVRSLDAQTMELHTYDRQAIWVIKSEMIPEIVCPAVVDLGDSPHAVYALEVLLPSSKFYSHRITSHWQLSTE